ncbi:major facilitator superfamily domain-containing protein 2B isoform X5 [Molossus molossus]|uniref:major facilitator superfamily domain-containing protein 2B isoform X5 n=1 Tax=Molossus molossus TaxID=27622 RepID=UPI001746A165|nr:major facilitator superfamily domain-containing protein 2B isoform X5 [Molossus molossus]
MAASPGGSPAPAVEEPAPQPEAHAREPGSDRRASRGRLSFCTKVCYGIGGVPNQVASSATAFYLQLFLLDVAQIPAAQVSLVMFGGKVSGAAADPVAGFFISRSRRTGSGRLMPWVLGCTPFIALAYFFLWFLPPFTNLRGLWYMTFYCLFQALATGGHLSSPCAPVFPGALHSAHHAVDPQPQGAGHHHRLPDDHGDGGDAHGSHGPRTHRVWCPQSPQVRGGRVPRAGRCLPQRYPSAPVSSQDTSFLAGLALTVRHPPYLKLVISFLFISAAVQVEQSYLVLFCTHASRLHDHVQSLVLTILVSAVLSTPLWEWVLQRFGKRTSAFGICMMVPFAILLAAVPTAPVAYVVAFVSGVSIAVSLLLPWSMLPDVVDDFQLQHQHGMETIFYSSYVFFTKLSGAGALGISTLSLEFAGYEAGACKQAEQVVVTLKVLIGAVPTCMILTGLCILMVGPALKVPSQDTSRRLSLRRWAPHAHGYTQ